MYMKHLHKSKLYDKVYQKSLTIVLNTPELPTPATHPHLSPNGQSFSSVSG